MLFYYLGDKNVTSDFWHVFSAIIWVRCSGRSLLFYNVGVEGLTVAFYIVLMKTETAK